MCLLDNLTWFADLKQAVQYVGNKTRIFKWKAKHPIKLLSVVPRNKKYFERLFHQIIIKEYLNATKRIESLQLLSAHERYNELLIETDLVKHIPLKYIASYLGITQVSLSRIRANA